MGRRKWTSFVYKRRSALTVDELTGDVTSLLKRHPFTPTSFSFPYEVVEIKTDVGRVKYVGSCSGSGTCMAGL